MTVLSSTAIEIFRGGGRYLVYGLANKQRNRNFGTARCIVAHARRGWSTEDYSDPDSTGCLSCFRDRFFAPVQCMVAVNVPSPRSMMPLALDMERIETWLRRLPSHAFVDRRRLFWYGICNYFPECCVPSTSSCSIVSGSRACSVLESRSNLRLEPWRALLFSNCSIHYSFADGEIRHVTKLCSMSPPHPNISALCLWKITSMPMFTYRGWFQGTQIGSENNKGANMKDLPRQRGPQGLIGPYQTSSMYHRSTTLILESYYQYVHAGWHL